MIRQQINLYQDRFREPRVLLSAVQSLWLLGVLTLLMLAGSYHYQSTFWQLQSVHDDRLQEKALAEQELAINRKQLDAALADTRLDRQMRELLKDIDSRKRLIRFVELNSLGSGDGFSSQLQDLSAIEVDNVWLSEISLGNNFVRLSGSALKAEDVPLYFHQFRQRRLFKGRAFDIFELKRDQEQDWKVDFVIASRSKSDE